MKTLREILAEAEAVNEAKADKVYTITISRRGKDRDVSGTISELIDAHRYTLETGKSYENERGNSKIKMDHKTIDSLVNHLNKAATNASSNRNPSTSYSVKNT